MATANSWSVQVLAYEQHTIGGQTTQLRTLSVCIAGNELFAREFAEGKYKDKNSLFVPFDFVVLGGVPCPRGKFYEIEYTIGEKTGIVYRGLIQAVDPVTDLQLIIGKLCHDGYLPADINPRKAWLRSDIDAVSVCRCSMDDDDEPVACGGLVTPREEQYSILEVLGRDPSFPAMSSSSVCLELYNSDHCREVWINHDDRFESQPIFVCGSSNVRNPEFADMFKVDIAEALEHLTAVYGILRDYNLSYITAIELPDKEEGQPDVIVMDKNCQPAFISQFAKYLMDDLSKQAPADE